MTGPITGYGAQQLSSQTQQNAQSAQQDSVRQTENPERNTVPNEIRPTKAPAAETHNATGQENITNPNKDDGEQNQRPGSIVNILV